MNINPLINTYPASSKQKFRGQQSENNYKEYRQRKLNYGEKLNKYEYKHSKPHTKFECETLIYDEAHDKEFFYGALPAIIGTFSLIISSQYVKSPKLRSILKKCGWASVAPAIILPFIIFDNCFPKIKNKRFKECGFEKSP